jgi:DNA-binding NarL/FixJ family response regulator
MISVLIRAKKTISSESLLATVRSHARFRKVQLVETDAELAETLQDADVLLVIPETRESLKRLTFTLERIRVQNPKMRIIVLMERRDRELVVGAFKKGASGVFCQQSSGLDDLWKCIEKVHEGQIWANSEELEWVMEAFQVHWPMNKPIGVVNASGVRLLSKREEDVVNLLVDGMQNRAIAESLGLSEHTVKNYLFRIYDKLGISTRSELMLYVLTPREKVS